MGWRGIIKKSICCGCVLEKKYIKKNTNSHSNNLKSLTLKFKNFLKNKNITNIYIMIQNEYKKRRPKIHIQINKK